MGIEYRIRFPINADQLDRALRALRFFSDFDNTHCLYNLRSDPVSVLGQPDAWAKIEKEGLYYCDNGGPVAERALMFRALIDLALRHSEKVEIEAL